MDLLHLVGKDEASLRRLVALLFGVRDHPRIHLLELVGLTCHCHLEIIRSICQFLPERAGERGHEQFQPPPQREKA